MSMTHPSGAFVRQDMIPAEAPPKSAQGTLRWLRENLFSGPLNIALTVIGAALIVWLVRLCLPWLSHSVWHANSLGECRQIIAATWGEGATGACWAVIRERWYQYLFGFYPQDLVWRPVLAFALLFLALAPVLFQTVPRKLMWFTALYPLLTFWLLWGGSIWLPVMVLVGFGFGAFAYSATVASVGAPVAAGIALVVAAVEWIYLTGPVSNALTGALPITLARIASDQFGGFVLSLTIGVISIAGSLPLGILLALGRRSDMFLIHKLSVMFIEFIRGVPLITILFTASLLLNYFLPPRVQFDIILRVIIMVTFFSAAYIAEVIRGGLASLPKGQYEAADALGLDFWKAQRLIIMPQALKVAIPGIVSSFIGLFKDTTLVAFVGLNDPLMGISEVVRADMHWKGVYWEPYIFVGIIFFLFCFGMSRYSMYLERRLKRDHR